MIKLVIPELLLFYSPILSCNASLPEYVHNRSHQHGASSFDLEGSQWEQPVGAICFLCSESSSSSFGE